MDTILDKINKTGMDSLTQKKKIFYITCNYLNILLIFIVYDTNKS